VCCLICKAVHHKKYFFEDEGNGHSSSSRLSRNKGGARMVQ
jgi:hypothetical protein